MTATKALVNSFRGVLFPHVTNHPPTLRVAKVRNWTSAMRVAIDRCPEHLLIVIYNVLIC